MIKLFEEYTEFRKIDSFNFANYEITKNNWQNMLRDLQDFLVIGEWYRIFYSELRKNSHFLDQSYIDKYLYLE